MPSAAVVLPSAPAFLDDPKNLFGTPKPGILRRGGRRPVWPSVGISWSTNSTFVFRGAMQWCRLPSMYSKTRKSSPPRHVCAGCRSAIRAGARTVPYCLQELHQMPRKGKPFFSAALAFSILLVDLRSEMAAAARTSESAKDSTFRCHEPSRTSGSCLHASQDLQARSEGARRDRVLLARLGLATIATVTWDWLEGLQWLPTSVQERTAMNSWCTSRARLWRLL